MRTAEKRRNQRVDLNERSCVTLTDLFLTDPQAIAVMAALEQDG